MKTPEEMAEEWLKNRKAYSSCIDIPTKIRLQSQAREGFLAGYKAAENHFRDATEKVKPQWISVKDRLPEINKGFIGFAENKEVCNCYRYPDHSEDSRPVFYAQTKTGLLICGLESISHWMDLPKPPKEEK